jgi:hypothetical protein
MLITVDSPEASEYLIYDSAGHKIPYVISFDTETEDIELAVSVPKKDVDDNTPPLLMQSAAQEDGSVFNTPIFVKFKLCGAYALKNGEAIN